MSTYQHNYRPWWSRFFQWLSENLTNQPSFAAFFEPIIQWFLPHWRVSAYRAKILLVRKENDTVFTLVMRPLGSWPEFKAGQFIEILVDYSGSLTSRFFSISSAPRQYKQTQTIELTIKIQTEGKITPWLPSQLTSGDIINIQAAIGEFTLENTNQPTLMIAGGSGITPFRSMLQEHTAQKNTDNQRQDIDITLLYYAKNQQQFLFSEELKALAEANPGFKLHLITTDTRGRFCQQHLQEYCSDAVQRNTLICGPTSMIQGVQHQLEKAGLSSDRIVSEYFGPSPPDLSELSKEINGTHSTDRVQQASKVHFGRSNRQIDVKPDATNNLLSLAEDLNLNPVSGCRMGVCHQCICHKKTGIIFNTKTQTFSDTGPQNIQLCISVPVGDVEIEL